ncbi:hypothetical protein HG536_0E05940 [Torulaspora globosa]|uniref:Ketoreductase (KR) domain-containing protein n=1 Tax=Torulaspora globosa TaxID=48254 RepID=A0A7G3ZJJ5_9SACH|nr:uncharacterized protein HG536_0E05940 [Torulaspora globosa]QLL33681.1 hypothetical protein HG536_0E05940 [Torulaspora globosa]
MRIASQRNYRRSMALKLGSQASLTELFDAAIKRFGRIDIAINNVGKMLKKPFTEVTEVEFDEMDVVNNKVAFFFISESMKKVADGGRIIMLASSLLAAYTPFYTPYQGTKAASKEMMEKNITVNCVAPGPMDTPFLYAQETPEAVEFFKSSALQHRLTDIKDIVPIINFLATDGGWITGQVIFANGGLAAN